MMIVKEIIYIFTFFNEFFLNYITYENKNLRYPRFNTHI